MNNNYTINHNSINKFPFATKKANITKSNLQEKLFLNNTITLKEASQLSGFMSTGASPF